jgi:hypothetical protein
MDLKNIELPPFVIAELYRSSIIDPGEIPASIQRINAVEEFPVIVDEAAPSSSPAWKWLGGNRKNILVVVRHKSVPHLPENELSVLTGMLTACQLSLADVAIVNISCQPSSGYKEVITQFNSRIVFLFGVEPATFGLPMSFPHFQVQGFANSSFLFIPDLSELENDKVLKSKLWVCLRRIFNI